MRNKNIKNGKAEHHDDCQDCRREKKENEALIAIYQRLQVVDNNSKLMRKSLQKHKQQFEATTSKFNDFVTKLSQVPKQTKADIQLKNLGYDLANSMLYEVNKGQVARQNERLKQTLAQLYKPKSINLSNVTQTRRSSSTNTNNQETQSKQINNESNKSVGKGMRNSFYKSFDVSHRYTPTFQIKEVREPEETRATGFFSHQSCNPKIEGLNLWLYEQNDSKGVQEQLYQTRAAPKNRLYKINKPRGAVLPALRTTANKF